MTRAAESVLFNIVEGCGSSSQRDFAHYLEISIKSSRELEVQVELANDYGIMQETTWRDLTSQAIDARRMLCGLRARVLESQAVENAKTANRKR